MNVLVLDETLDCAASLAEVFLRAGHVLKGAAGVEAALAQLERELPEVIIARWHPGSAGLSALREGIDRLGDGVYFLAVVDDGGDAARYEALEAGADGTVAATGTTRDFDACRGAAERAVRKNHDLRVRLGELTAALQRADLREGARRVLFARAWIKLEATLLAMCAEYLHEPFLPVVAATLPRGQFSACSVELVEVGSGARVELAFVVPQGAEKMIATLFVGDADLVDDAVVADVLLELGNSGMGAIKAAFLEEHLLLTGSLPKISTFDPGTYLEGAIASHILAFRNHVTSLHAVAVLRQVQHTRRSARDLREGMVLASDVKNDAGQILAVAGTRLTSSTAERIAEVMPLAEIELCGAA